MEVEKKKKKKKKIGTYFFLMLLLFIVLYLFQQFGSQILLNSFTYIKYGPDIIGESIWAILVLIIVLIFGNSYIFKEDREKIGSSLWFGFPVIAISIIFLIVGIVQTDQPFNIPTVLNLAVFCLLIGIVEEFMCRGWLLNEFLERYSDSKKHIILSIVLSSLIFGAMHIINLFAGQPLLLTLLQILNAACAGIIFALIYYKTRNIWSVVLIHAFWDFALFLPESVYLGDAVYGDMSKLVAFYSVFVIVIAVLCLLLLCFYYYKRIKFVETDVVDNNSKILTIGLPVLAIVVYSFINCVGPAEYQEYGSFVSYESKSLGNNYDTHYLLHDEYYINEIREVEVIRDKEDSKEEVSYKQIKYDYKLFVDDDKKLIFKNINTDEEINLLDNVFDYLMYENKDSYFILAETFDLNVVYYVKIRKTDLCSDNLLLSGIKDSLIKYNTPNIDIIGVITVNDYNYPIVKTDIHDRLYIDIDNVMYLDAK